jgi:hypothetical protein
MIGSYLYLTAMRPDIQFSMSMRSFSGVTEDIASVGHPTDFQVS